MCPQWFALAFGNGAQYPRPQLPTKRLGGKPGTLGVDHDKQRVGHHPDRLTRRARFGGRFDSAALHRNGPQIADVKIGKESEIVKVRVQRTTGDTQCFAIGSGLRLRCGGGDCLIYRRWNRVSLWLEFNLKLCRARNGLSGGPRIDAGQSFGHAKVANAANTRRQDERLGVSRSRRL